MKKKRSYFQPLAVSVSPGLGNTYAAQCVTPADLAFTFHPCPSLTCVNADRKEQEKVVFPSGDVSTYHNIPE